MHEETNYELEERFLTADRLISEGQLREAAQTLDDILAEAPDFGKAHNHLGWLYENKFKNYDRAEEHYRLAVKFAPGYAAAYYNYCYCLAALRKHEELEIVLGLALKVPGINYATLYNEYGMMREMQGRYDDAIHYFRLHIQNCFDSKTIDSAVESISRCTRKKNLINQ